MDCVHSVDFLKTHLLLWCISAFAYVFFIVLSRETALLLKCVIGLIHLQLIIVIIGCVVVLFYFRPVGKIVIILPLK